MVWTVGVLVSFVCLEGRWVGLGWEGQRGLIEEEGGCADILWIDYQKWRPIAFASSKLLRRPYHGKSTRTNS